MFIYFLLIFNFLNLFSKSPDFLQIKINWVEEQIKKMTLEEKIAQVFMPNIDLDKGEKEVERVCNIINKYNVGGIFLGSSCDPEKQIEIVNKLQASSKLPLLIGQDLEWGLAMRLKNCINFPKNLTLGAIQDNNSIYKLGVEIARQTKLVGVHLNAAPVVDVNSNPDNPVIGFRSFGDNKFNVADKAKCFIAGLQDGGVLACAKHFPGHGDTNIDSHKDLPKVDKNIRDLFECELYPFKECIDSGVSAIMSAHILLPKIDSIFPATLSEFIIKDLLKKELGFEGLVLSDALDMKAITKMYDPEIANFFAYAAGCDILLFPDRIEESILAIKKAIEAGVLKEDELDRRVLKILKAKEFLGLNKNRFVENINSKDINSQAAKDLKKELYANSVTLINNFGINNSVLLPINNNENIGVINIGNDFETFNRELKNHFGDKIIFLDKVLDNKENFNFDILILNLFTTLRGKFDDKIFDALKKYKNKKIILVLFGNPYCLKKINFSGPTIITYENDVDAQDIVANIITGKIQAMGKLPINL